MRNIQRIRSLATTPMAFTAANTYIGQVGELVSVFDDSDGTAVALRIHDGNTIGGLHYYQINSYVPSSDPNAPNQDSVDNTYTGIPSGWLTDNVIDYSAFFDGSSYLGKTYSSSTTTLSTYTFSLWVKFSFIAQQENTLLSFKTTGDNGNESGSFHINPSNSLTVYYQNTGTYQSSQLFKDTLTWYHLVFSTNSSVYVNGQSISNSVSMPPIVLGHHTSSEEGNANASIKIGDWWPRTSSTNYPINGHMANIQLIDGAALDANYFGETVEGNWIHRPYDGTSTVEGATPVSGLSGTNDKYGTNGFYLNFADESNLGKDVSGNGNDWT